MSGLDEALAQAAKAAPGAVAMLGDRDGVLWSGAAGALGPGDDAPMEEEALFRIFSMSKAVACIGAMTLVEEGRLDLDAPVARYAPEFADIPVLEGFDGETPKLRRQSRAPAVRDLMTHSVGLDYEFWNAKALEHMQKIGRGPAAPSSLDALKAVPIYAEDGRWSYGVAIDWLGVVMERICGQRIDAILREKLFAPLHMMRTVFEREHAGAAPLTHPAAKTGDGFKPSRLSPQPEPELYGMGHALWSTAGDYMRLLRMLLRGGELDGARILKPESVALLFSAEGMPEAGAMTSAMPQVAADIGFLPGTEPRQGLAFIVNTQDARGMRRAGAGGWAGILNTHFWVDPKAGLAGVLMTQLLPFGCPDLMAAWMAFERAAYAEHAVPA